MLNITYLLFLFIHWKNFFAIYISDKMLIQSSFISKMTKKPIGNGKRIGSGSSQKRKIVTREHLAYIRTKSQLNCSVVLLCHTVLRE